MLHRLKPEFSSKLSVHFNSILMPRQNFFNLEPMMLISKKGQHFWATHQERESTQLLQDSFIFLLHLFQYQLKAELKIEFYFESILNDLLQQILSWAQLTIEKLWQVPHLCCFHFSFLVFHLLFIYRLVRVEAAVQQLLRQPYHMVQDFRVLQQALVVIQVTIYQDF